MPRFIESMTKIDIQNWRLRIWREEKELRVHYDETEKEIRSVIDLFYKATLGTMVYQDIVPLMEIIAHDVPRIEAIEAINTWDGCGVILYPDWR